ncbi:MAG: sugar phosphorylase [Leptolyngbyaceae bacterium]|nr:sugar phosphorylase [Leptolyngbyaceae bacterium]
MNRTKSATPIEQFSRSVKPLLISVYNPLGIDVEALCDRIIELISPYWQVAPQKSKKLWSQSDTLLITYGDSIRRDGDETPLQTLHHFLKEYLQDTITAVHILPFFPYSSDDGFAVIDYLKVNPDLGDWDDVGRIAEQFDLMTDLVINHVSGEHEWVQQFKQNEAPGRDYFITVDPETDVSDVVRPRNTPLLCPLETTAGTKHVWATFSHDQIDTNMANPDVLLEFLQIILYYLKNGARILRLDAIGYLWKQLGTSCIHLTETHTLIKAIREIVKLIRPDAIIVTETNVPNRENLTYFGNRNEAHLIYNFSLPPLIVNALYQERSQHLKTWMMSMPPAPVGCAYLNFTASHDGIGLRPAEGLLDPAEYETFLKCIQEFGGEISMRARPDGSESPYEANIALFDALKGTAKGEDEFQIPRFICSQVIMMSLEGIPAFYLHSLLATPNDYDAVKQTGRKRSINRHQWDYDDLVTKLQNADSNQAIVLKELSRLIQIRRQQAAFHPNATQYTLHLQPELFAFWRQSMTRDQSIFSIHNLTSRSQTLKLHELNLIVTDSWFDLISETLIEEGTTEFLLEPYQSAWITNKFG